MNKIVNDYKNFINESKLELLLEAKIQFMPRFTNLISRIESPVADALEDVIGKEVDINTNFIDISEKDDTILFVPDDKVSKVKHVVTSEPLIVYNHLAQNAKSNNSYPIGTLGDPTEGTVGEIFHKLTLDELNNILESPTWQESEDWKNDFLVHFRWKDFEGVERNNLVKNSGLELDVSDYKKSEFKVGKFVNKILKNAGLTFSSVQIEDFVNKYKTQMKVRNNTLNKFQIVTGEDIRKYYNMETYLRKTGSLWGSCMKGRSCQPYFDIYVDNPEQVSMVILKADGYVEDYVDEDTGEILTLPLENKIMGRALLWTDRNDRKVMDRIYVNDSSDVEFFKQYAIINNFLYKKNQDFNEDTPFMFNNKQLSREESIIIVDFPESTSYKEYPYMDTLKFYTIESGILTNHDFGGYDLYLEGTEGNAGACTFCDGRGEVGCPECYGSGTEECVECEGSGLETCELCNGNEEVPCPDCDGNDSDCVICKGDGDVSCPECDGDGTKFCLDCKGDGDIKCSMCDGEDTVPCPECG